MDRLEIQPLLRITNTFVTSDTYYPNKENLKLQKV